MIDERGSTSGPECDDAVLCQAAGRGNAAAFETLYRRHADGVYRFCCMRVGGEQAHDATQDTFMAVLKGAAPFRGEATFRSWILGIAARRCVDVLRRRGAPSERSVEDLPQDAMPAALDPAARSTARLAVSDGMCRLSPAQREALFLVYYRGFSYEEAAYALEVPVGTVKSRVHAGRTQLREVLRDDE
jgi:RNA polymerase sigma-70 factor, ECF subfamily